MDIRDRIATALLTLRLGVFLVMFVWTIDKFLNVEHAAQVFQGFYGLGGLGPTAFLVVGGLELVIVVAFVVGYQKRLSYGLVFALHAVSTLSSYRRYLDPFNNLLFFAAWPMLAACFALYLLRDLDTRWTIGSAGRFNP